MGKIQGLYRIRGYGEGFDNMIIKGDNCTVCDCLMNEFASKVKCIYIDPPYNNGEVYTHYSDVSSHEQWLCYMKSIISRLFCLLSKDGSLWISIDDNEVHYLKVLCDEIMGRSNFVTTIIWQQRTTRENRRAFSNNHEYILVYAKNPIEFKKTRNLLDADGSVLARYKNPDNDPRGPWQSVSLNVQAGHAVSSQFYSITAPKGKVFNPPNGRCWIYNEERMKNEIANNNIWFGADQNSTPRKKKFLCDAKLGLTPETLWLSSTVGTTNDAKKQLLSLFPTMTVFDTPKPESLIRRVFEIASNEGDLVLDSFLGSGTTAAVAHKMNRAYIGIDVSTESINYALSRLERVIAGETSGISKEIGWQGGGSFSYYECYDNKNEKINRSLYSNRIVFSYKGSCASKAKGRSNAPFAMPGKYIKLSKKEGE